MTRWLICCVLVFGVAARAIADPETNNFEDLLRESEVRLVALDLEDTKASRKAAKKLRKLLGKAAKAPYKAVHDWTDHSGTKIKKGDFVIDLIYWDRPSTDDPLLFEDEAKKATVHAEHVLHANVAPTAAADDRVRVSEAVVAEIEAEYEVFLNT